VPIAPDAADKISAPAFLGIFGEAQGYVWDGHFYGPAAIVAAHGPAPDGIVAGIVFTGGVGTQVGLGPSGGYHKLKLILAIVEGIKGDHKPVGILIVHIPGGDLMQDAIGRRIVQVGTHIKRFIGVDQLHARGKTIGRGSAYAGA
jgi:hypothetical protein